MQTFDISSRKLVNYLLTLEAHYLNVPYHNSMHAADVAQAVHVLLLSPALDVSMSLIGSTRETFQNVRGFLMTRLACDQN